MNKPNYPILSAVPERKPNWAFYPFLFALFPVLFLFTYNIEEVTPAVLPVPLAASLILVTLFWLPFRLLLHDRQKAGLLTFVFSFMFFFYGRILTGIFPKMARKEPSAFLWTLWIWIILFLALAALVIYCRRNLNTVTALLNIFVTVLLIFSLWQISSFYLLSDRSFRPLTRDESEDRNLMRQSVIPRDKLPDIYYMIFDRYASNQNLLRFYDYDNTPFYSMLQGNGFFVADKSYCNHPGTYLSLCSSLNMDLLPELLGSAPVQKRVIYRMLQDSRVLRLVKALGYKYHHFGSWYEPTKVNRYADINYPETNLMSLNQDFYLKALNTTPLTFLVRSQLSVFPHRENVLQTFSEIARLGNRLGPKFVFLHMLVPHAPFVFGPNGERTDVDLGKYTVEQKYINQLIFLNKKIEELLKTIISRSKIPPIIIIQSDEGPSTGEKPINHIKKLRKNEKHISSIRIRYGILNTYLFPGKDKSIFYDTISPVNTFRLLFNSYFGTRYPLLPDIAFHTVDTKNEVVRFKKL